MKKKTIAAIALALSTFTLAACSATNQKLNFDPNWEAGILSEAATATAEELTYAVTFTENSFLQKNSFTVEYCGRNNSAPGVYTTKLEYLSNGTYSYSTSLTVPLTFTLSSGASDTKTDTIQTEAIFKKADKSLQPISSKKTVHCYSPRNAPATNLEDTHIEYEYEFSIVYNDELSGGTLTRTDLSETRTLFNKDKYPDGISTNDFSIDGEKYTYLDNEQLLFALRGLSNNAISASKTMSVYNASLLTVEAISTTPSTATKTKFNLALNGGETTEYEIEYTPISIKSGNKEVQTSQNLWYAKTTENNNNRYRNVLLKMTVDLHYGLGTFTYTLTDATFCKE